MGLIRCFKYIYNFYKMERLDYQTILNIQRQRFLNLLRYAKEKSTFYANLYRDIKIDDNLPIEDVPILDKKIIMDNLDNIITRNDITKDMLVNFINTEKDLFKLNNKYTVVHSSGTSGFLFISVLDDSCFDYEIASILYRKTKTLGLKPPRSAVVVTDNPHVGSTVFYKSIPRLIANVKHFSVKLPISILVEKLNDFNPEILGGFPGILKVLSDEKMKNHLKIYPKKIYSGSFLLTEDAKQSIITAFNLIPFVLYSTTEMTGPIAAECDHHSLHVFIDSLVFEILDEKDKPVAAGKPGKVVITNLMNFIQPVIRYRLGDVVQMALGKCRCGSPFPIIEKIWGREGDLIWVEKAKGDYEVIDPVLFYLKIPGIEKFQVIQEKNDLLIMKLVVTERTDQIIQQVKKKIFTVLKQKKLDKIVKLKMELVEDIAPIFGKHKMVISKIKKV